ncbi:MAG: cytochrome c oxidase subunit II [Rhodospirillales bacterium]|nr:cytochrome c oxidase subunit II [Rhodospirillales bacterium]
MKIAIALVLLTVGTVVFHFASPWWWTEIASNWGFIDTTILITFWVTGVVFVAVGLFTAYCCYKFSHREDRRADYEPENHKLEVWLTVATAVGVAIMLAPGLMAWNEFVTVPKGTPEIEVVGKQWDWIYRFPGKDGKLGKIDAKLISEKNPFGLSLKDPAGKDDILIEDNELHIPLGKPVKLLLRAQDVLHDYYVPQFRAKMDMVPGMVTFYWFTPTRTGTFDALCAELCGTGHYAMRGKVVVEKEDAFKKWLAGNPTFAKTQKAALENHDQPAGKGLAQADLDQTDTKSKRVN